MSEPPRLGISTYRPQPTASQAYGSLVFQCIGGWDWERIAREKWKQRQLAAAEAAAEPEEGEVVEEDATADAAAAGLATADGGAAAAAAAGGGAAAANGGGQDHDGGQDQASDLDPDLVCLIPKPEYGEHKTGRLSRAELSKAETGGGGRFSFVLLFERPHACRSPAQTQPATQTLP
jgi:hypothetical protein